MGKLRLSSKRNKTDFNSACYTCDMIRFLKTLLLWLIIAALPVQGLAAAINASCGPTHHTDAQVRIMVESPHHEDSATHHHGHAHEEISMDIQADSATDEDQQFKSSSCSACAACCVGAAAPPPVFIPATVPGGSQFVFISSAPLIISVTPAGLERPPKLVFA